MFQKVRTMLSSKLADHSDLEVGLDHGTSRIPLLINNSINEVSLDADMVANVSDRRQRTNTVSRIGFGENSTGTLSFSNVNYIIGPSPQLSRKSKKILRLPFTKRQENKQILFDVSGIFKNGMNAILGPTGSGKSSLLDILADRKGKHGITGTILVDGAPRHPSYKYAVGYVVQEDMFSGALTVKENLFFSANVRLSKSITMEEKIQRVSSVISDLGLEACADTRMGTAFIRGVSGGEKKRTCIGMELVLSPKILFLDEPTTGLDASTASNVIQCLKRLADNGRTIIFSIHQPRYSIFKLFDTVMFLCKGQCIYSGTGNELVPYFGTLGYQCEMHDNPTDFVLDILIEANRAPAVLTKLTDAYKQSSVNLEFSFSDPSNVATNNGTNNSNLSLQKIEVEPAQDWRTEIYYVSQRTLKNAIRNPALALAQVVVSIMMGLLVGLVFYNLRKTTDTGAQDRFGTIFFIIVNQVFSAMSAVEPLLQERPLYLHEYASGCYRARTYFISKLICDLLPLRAVPALLFSMLAYFMTGLARTYAQFFIFLVTIFMASVFGAAVCFFISTLVTTFAVALIIVVLIFAFMMVFSGFLIRLSNVFTWLSWIQWISALRYASNILSINEFQGLRLCLPDSPTVCPITGEQILDQQDISHGTTWDLWRNFVALTIMTGIFFTLAYIQLHRIKLHKHYS